MKKLVFISLFIFFCSCASNKINFKDNSVKKVYLPFKIEDIEIIDTRLQLLPMNWDVPMIATKKREWVGNPEISVDNRQDIVMILRQSEDINGTPTKITYKVLEGVCKLSASWKGVKEYVKFKGEIKIDVPSHNKIYTYSGEFFYEQPTINGTEKHTLLLYDLAVRNATHGMLSKLQKDLIIK